MPDYTNDATKKTEQQLGSFKYEENKDLDNIELIDRGPYKLDNGAIYIGQWSKDGLRYGRGT